MYCRIFILLLLIPFATSIQAQSRNDDHLPESLPCDFPTINSFGGPINGICQGDTAIIVVNGTLGDATHWELYTINCGGSSGATLQATSTTGVFYVSPNSHTTYFARGAGSCAANQPCENWLLKIHPSYDVDEIIDFFCVGGDWQFPDGTVATNITSTIWHTSHLQSVKGCDSMVTTLVSVIDPTATVTLNGGTLTAFHGYAAFQWVDCNNGFAPVPGATNATFTPTYSSQLAVVSSIGDCAHTSDCYSVTSVNREDLAETSFSLFPNPSQGEFVVEGELKDLQSVDVIDLQGKQLPIQVGSKTLHQMKLNLEEVPKGMYFLRLGTKDGMTVLPISVVRK